VDAVLHLRAQPQGVCAGHHVQRRQRLQLLTGCGRLRYNHRLSVRSGKVNKKAASAAIPGRNHHLSVFNLLLGSQT
jgi:hypothetical protein